MIKNIIKFLVYFFLSLFLIYIVFSIQISFNNQNHQNDSDVLFSLVQEWRIKNNLQPYTKDLRACDMALTRALDITKDFSHDKFLERYDNSNFPYPISENLSRGYSSEEDVLDAWIKSPTHLENLQKPFKYSCIVCVQNYCSHIFSNFSS